ncbi:MAG: hypothetical protein ACR2QO_14405 [Acidimicrobiales bacterium]
MSENSEIAAGRQAPLLPRAAATAIDGVTVAAPMLIVARLASERFPIEFRADGRARFSQADQQRINEIDESFNRAAEFGDNLYTLSGAGWWVTMAALLGLTVALLFIVPSRTGGRTIGKLALGVAGRAPAPAGEGPDLIDSAARVAMISSPEDEASAGEPEAEPVPVYELELPSESELIEQTEPEPQDGEEPATAPDKPGEPGPSVGTADDGSTIEELPDLAPLADFGDYEAWDRAETDLHSAMGPEYANGNGGFGVLALPESSLAESPLATTTIEQPSNGYGQARADEPIDAAHPGDAADATGGGTETPTWSNEHSAWVFQDPASGRWFRHDTETDRWEPIG